MGTVDLNTINTIIAIISMILDGILTLSFKLPEILRTRNIPKDYTAFEQQFRECNDKVERAIIFSIADRMEDFFTNIKEEELDEEKRSSLFLLYSERLAKAFFEYLEFKRMSEEIWNSYNKADNLVRKFRLFSIGGAILLVCSVGMYFKQTTQAFYPILILSLLLFVVSLYYLNIWRIEYNTNLQKSINKLREKYDKIEKFGENIIGGLTG